MVDQPPIEPPHLSQHTDLPCVRCAYSLTGLPLDAVCPECGTPISNTITGDRLEFADADYLASLTKGATLLNRATTCILVLIISLLLLAIGFAIAWEMIGTPIGEQFEGVGTFLVLAWILFSMVLWFLGSLHLLTPDPHAPEPPNVASARSTARFTAKIAFISSALIIIAQLAYQAFGGDAVFFGPALLLPGIAFFFHFQAMCTHTRFLAGRIPDPKLVKTIRRARIISFAVVLWVLEPITGLLSILPRSLMMQGSGLRSLIVLPLSLVLLIAIVIIGFSPLIWICYASSATGKLARALRRITPKTTQAQTTNDP